MATLTDGSYFQHGVFYYYPTVSTLKRIVFGAKHIWDRQIERHTDGRIAALLNAPTLV